MARTQDRTRETRVRRSVERRGFQLQKSRRRDPDGWDYGTYQVIDSRTNTLVFGDFTTGHGFGLSLDDIENWLSRTAKCAGDVDPAKLDELRAVLIKLRDEAASAINRLDESPPTSEQEYLAEKTRLMSTFRELSIMAISMPHGAA